MYSVNTLIPLARATKSQVEQPAAATTPHLVDAVALATISTALKVLEALEVLAPVLVLLVWLPLALVPPAPAAAAGKLPARPLQRLMTQAVSLATTPLGVFCVSLWILQQAHTGLCRTGRKPAGAADASDAGATGAGGALGASQGSRVSGASDDSSRSPIAGGRGLSRGEEISSDDKSGSLGRALGC